MVNSLNQTSTLLFFLGANEALFMYSCLVNTSSMSQFNDIIEVYKIFSFFVNIKWQIIYSFCKFVFLDHNKNLKRLSYAYAKHLLFANYFCHIVFSIDTKKKERLFRGIKLEWGYDKVIPLKTFNDASNGYLVDDTCVFGAEVFVSKQRSIDKEECLALIKDSITKKSVIRFDNYSKLTGESHYSAPFSDGNHKWYLFMNYDQLS